MKRESLLYIALGAGSLLFLGATRNPESEPYMQWDVIRPHPTQNIDVGPLGGYLVVGTSAGEYVVDRRDVMSVSCSTYDVEGGMRVWEVTVSERSSNTVRWYYTKPIPVEPVSAGSPSEEGAGGKLDTLDKKPTDAPPAAPPNTPGSPGNMVRKHYPLTTHAHTIEYRVPTKRGLQDIYAYLNLMVYGWSPMQERPRTARKIYPYAGQGAWLEWNAE